MDYPYLLLYLLYPADMVGVVYVHVATGIVDSQTVTVVDCGRLYIMPTFDEQQRRSFGVAISICLVYSDILYLWWLCIPSRFRGEVVTQIVVRAYTGI